jgi:hypoxia up-regulated 1
LQVIREYEKLDKPFSRIANKKKPKPPPEPAQPAKEGSSEAEGGASSPDGEREGGHVGVDADAVPGA